MKKAIILAIAFSLSTGLAACSKSAPEEKAENAADTTNSNGTDRNDGGIRG